ncbi:hypothetical protein CJF43_17665 [Pseudomonas fragi]|uniref:Uncharacterized protein n=1 Tax=Pseudomonas fragi TaxID=296 RepID=A0A266LQX4_PSEFR|nr:hypothetical protein CJF43_17665 [Pseudomonas fragi]
MGGICEQRRCTDPALTPGGKNTPQFLWERACSRRHPCGLPERPRRLHREQARSHITRPRTRS